MAKHNGVTVRLGAAYDAVVVPGVATFDRAQMRMDGKKNLVKTLNQEVVDAYSAEHGLNKNKARNRRERKLADKAKRVA